MIEVGTGAERPLDDFLPTLTMAAKNLATEMTNHSVRDMLGQRGIQPEQLPAEEDIKKLERRVKSDDKKIEKQSGKLPKPDTQGHHP